MLSVTVVCPHCGSTGTFNIGVSNGTGFGQCRRCHKTFHIEMRNGSVHSVYK